MNTFVCIFTIDKHGRRSEFTCTRKEFPSAAMDILEKNLDKQTKVYYTVGNMTEELDYYNLPGVNDV